MKIARYNKIILWNGLKFVLGFENRKFDSGSFKSIYDIRLHRGIFALFIYINIVQETLVGDKMVPLLRTIHIPTTEYGKMTHQIIENPIYIPLNRREIKDIEV